MDSHTRWLLAGIHIHLHLQEQLRRRLASRDQRGDVPGWVLVTVMTLTVGFGLFTLARPELTGMLRSALNSVQ